MTKLMNIIPTEHLGAIRISQLASHMVLGQYAVKDSTYRDFYRDLYGKGHYIMVDNGAAEPLEHRVSWESVLKYANIMGYDCIVLPDVLFDAKQSYERSLAASRDVPFYKRAICPQGETIDEWKECCKDMLYNIPCNTVCIPKHLERHDGGRVKVMEWMRKKFHDLLRIHWLGVYENPILEIKNAVSCGVDTIDTGAAVAFAQNMQVINRLHKHYSLEWEWQGEETDPGLISRNISTLAEVCGAHYN